MIRAHAPKSCRLASIAALLVAAIARAGEPIPDVDVILEQIPGGDLMRVEETTGHPFDRLDFKDLPKDFVQAMDGAPLPAGWSLHKDGRRVWLEGPPPGKPVRLKVHIGAVKRPETLSYEVSLAGRKLLARQKQPVKTVAKQGVVGSLQGIVQMPTQVAPGEPLQMKLLAPSALPAGGTWTLSGTVVADDEREDRGETRAGEPKRRVALVVPPGRGAETPDRALEDIATVLAALGVPEGSWDVVPLAEGDPLLEDAATVIWAVVREAVSTSRLTASGLAAARRQQERDNQEVAKPPGIAGKPPNGGWRSSHGVSQLMKMKHDSAKSVIQNIRRELAGRPPAEGGVGVYAVRPAAAPGEVAAPILVVAGIAINEEEDLVIADPPSPDDPPSLWRCESAGQSRRCCRKAGMVWEDGSCGYGYDFERLPSERCYLEMMEAEDPPFCVRPSQIAVPGEVTETPDGGRVHAFDWRGRRNTMVQALAAPDGTVVFDRLPDDLQTGDTLAVRYLDAFGEVLVDVPSVPDVEVVEPRNGSEARITLAQPRSVAGQLACVCGSFPGPSAWNALLLDAREVGSPVSASGRMAWVQLSADLAPGEHVFTGAAAAGFPPTDRASTLVLQVGGELDSSKLQQLQTTPMRLWVVGTEEPVDLRVRNLTPGIISIDGGEDQTIRTSGGARNMLERTVRGLAPGAFNINYELGGDPCPCAAGR